MIDAEPFLRSSDSSESAERQRVLRRIAAALGLPVAAFSEPPPSREPSPPSNAECAAILAAFTRIEDAGVRASCLQLLQNLADR